MKYRIKIKTYGSGRITYSPQVKKFFGWSGIGYDGTSGYLYDDSECQCFESALSRIKRNFNGDAKVHSVSFEVVNESQITKN